MTPKTMRRCIAVLGRCVHEKWGRLARGKEPLPYEYAEWDASTLCYHCVLEAPGWCDLGSCFDLSSKWEKAAARGIASPRAKAAAQAVLEFIESKRQELKNMVPRSGRSKRAAGR